MMRAKAHAAHAGCGVHDTSAEHPGHDDREHEFSWTEGARIALVALAATAVWFYVWEPLRSVSAIGVDRKSVV